MSLRRRRECINCGRRFTTYEIIEEVPLMVLKKNGRRELFDRGKLLNGLLRSCDKRTVPMSVMVGNKDISSVTTPFLLIILK